MRLTTLLQVAAILVFVQPLNAAEGPGIDSLRFLLGTWRARGVGAPGEATGSAEFTQGLSGHVIFRKSFAEYPPKAGKPAYRHDDFMVIYADADSSVRADYFDNEGHVIRYAVRSPAPGSAEFLSPATQSGPGYRLTYTLGASGNLDGKFEVAPPGGAGRFTTYLEWSSERGGNAAAPGR